MSQVQTNEQNRRCAAQRRRDLPDNAMSQGSLEQSRIVGSARGGEILAVESQSRRSYSRHTHEDYGIGLMLNGAQRSWSGRGLVEAEAGDVISVNPGEVHDGSPIREHRAWCMLYLAPSLVARVVADVCEGSRDAFEFSDPVISCRVARIRFTNTFAAVREQIDAAAADEALILLLSGLMRRGKSQPDVVPTHIARVKEQIDDDPTQAHPLEALAQIAGVSRYQTIRGFKRLVGLTPHAYVLQRRLHLARRLITDGCSLAEAASGAGFADQSHFHRNFLRSYGMTPGAYSDAAR